MIDIRSHPLLGGMFADESIPAAGPGKPTEELTAAHAARPSMHEHRPSMNEPRISMTSMRPLRRTETLGSQIGEYFNPRPRLALILTFCRVLQICRPAAGHLSARSVASISAQRREAESSARRAVGRVRTT